MDESLSQEGGSTRAVDSIAAFLSPESTREFGPSEVPVTSLADELPRASRSVEILRALAAGPAHVSELSANLSLGLLDTAEAIRSLDDSGLITVDSASNDELVSLTPEGTKLLPTLGREV